MLALGITIKDEESTVTGRLKSERKAPEVVKYIMQPFLADLGEYFDVHLKIHKAHVVMLCEQELLSGDEARTLLEAMRAMGDAGQEGLGDSVDTDLYMKMEGFVTALAGELGGKMHMGRSRNDLYATGARIMTRGKLIALLADVIELQQVILRRAGEHIDTVMPGYTHLQHAEPITFGHYLLAFHDAIARDVTRGWAAYDNTNLNALGAAALSASSFDLDRERTAALLGFSGLIENSYDAVASRDYIVESVAMLATLSANIARVADNFILWSTSEFDMIDLPDEYGYTSSIMPQKRNPGYFLESVRSKSARVTGNLMSVLATLKGTPFAQSRDTSYEITVSAFDAFTEATGIVNVMRGVVAAVSPKRENMASNCAGEFSGSTEIANTIVRETGLPFRSAYKVVATVVRQAAAAGMRPGAVTAQTIDAAAIEVLGRPVGLTESQVRDALDPARNVEMKKTVGGPSRHSIEAMLRSRHVASGLAARNLADRQSALRSADAGLEQAITAICAKT